MPFDKGSLDREREEEQEPFSEREIDSTMLDPEEESDRRSLMATLRRAYQQAKHGRPRAGGSGRSRSQKGVDRTMSFLLLAGAVVVMFFVFLGLFSTSGAEKRGREQRIEPRLGRRQTPGAGQSRGSLTPLLNADVNQKDPNAGMLRPEDVLATSRRSRIGDDRGSEEPALESDAPPARDYALANIPPFETPSPELQPPVEGQSPAKPAPAPAQHKSNELNKSSLVFVRTTTTTARPGRTEHSPKERVKQGQPRRPLLPTGTRLVARLQTPASTAVKAPVIAAIEYNYERDGRIAVPAGSKAYGKIGTANKQGYVGIRFHTLAMPDGSAVSIDGGAMGLDYGPLKGRVTGRNRGKRILVRAVTGIGTMASYLVGGRGYSLSGPLDQSALLRERIASNIGMAGEQELMRMAFSGNIVVTVPGQTRFFIVLRHGAGESAETGRAPALGDSARDLADRNVLPTAQELRELIALKKELVQMNQQVAATRTAVPYSQQP